MTLKESDYVKLMGGKGVDSSTASAHYSRMSSMKASFQSANPSAGPGCLGLFGAVNVGSGACWWDYGQLKLYSRNNLKLVEEGENSDLLRMFLGISDRVGNGSELKEGTATEGGSCVFASKIGGKAVIGSVLSCVNCPDVEADGAILVNVTAKKIR